MKRILSTSILCATGLAFASCSQSKPENEGGTKADAAAPATEIFMTDVDVEEAGDLLERDSEIVVIDVRTPGEFAGGHLGGALNIDFNSPDFKDGLAELDREKTYLMHCQSGGRSTQAKPAFTELGFKYLFHLDGGYMAWEEAGKPTAK